MGRFGMEFLFFLILCGLIGFFVWKSTQTKQATVATTGAAAVRTAHISTDLHPAVDRVFSRPPDHDKSRKRSAERAIANESSAIIAALKPDEKLRAVAHDTAFSGGVSWL